MPKLGRGSAEMMKEGSAAAAAAVASRASVVGRAMPGRMLFVAAGSSPGQVGGVDWAGRWVVRRSRVRKSMGDCRGGLRLIASADESRGGVDTHFDVKTG